MSTAIAENRRLAKFSRICLALPEATRRVHGSHAGFYVRDRTFAYFLDDHHGDGIVSIYCKVPPGDAAAFIAAEPSRFYRPAYLGSKGWIALRLDVGAIDWLEVADFAVDSYRLIAPKRLAALAGSARELLRSPRTRRSSR